MVSLPASTVRALHECFARGMSIRASARVAGCANSTAQEYHRKPWPRDVEELCVSCLCLGSAIVPCGCLAPSWKEGAAKAIARAARTGLE